MSSIKPRKPQRGDKVLQSLYDSVCQIIDFLPSLQIVGDNKTLKVDSFGSGKTISVIKPANSAISPISKDEKPEQQVFLGIVITSQDTTNVSVKLSEDGGMTFNGPVVKINFTALSLASTIKEGTILIVYKGLANVVGGSQNL